MDCKLIDVTQNYFQYMADACISLCHIYNFICYVIIINYHNGISNLPRACFYFHFKDFYVRFMYDMMMHLKLLLAFHPI